MPVTVCGGREVEMWRVIGEYGGRTSRAAEGGGSNRREQGAMRRAAAAARQQSVLRSDRKDTRVGNLNGGDVTHALQLRFLPLSPWAIASCGARALTPRTRSLRPLTRYGALQTGIMLRL